MPVGFKSMGVNNTFVQIDSDYRGLRLTDHQRIVTNQYTVNQYYGLQNGLNVQGNTYVTYYLREVLVRGQFPMVAFRCGVACIVNMRQQGADWVFQFITMGVADVEYWVFNELVPQDSHIGFQIRRPDGSIVFDANDSPAKVMDYIAIPANFGGPSLYGGEAVLRDYGRGTFAAVLGNFQCTKFVGSTFVSGATRNGTWMSSVGVRMVGNQLIAGHYVFTSLGGGATNLFPRSSYAGISCTVMDLERL
jgi:hypothetical protein